MNATLPVSISLLVLLSACASSGVDRAEGTAIAMREMKDALAAAPDKVNAVSASLGELSKEGGDMKAEFATFDGNVDALVAHRDQVRSLRSTVESNRTMFTSEWEKKVATITDADLKKRAEERRAAVVEKFTALSKEADSARETFDPWMTKVMEVRNYLENDLNPAGVASVRDVVRDVERGANAVNKKIAGIVEELEAMSKAIAAAKPPAPEPTDEKK